MVKQQEKILVAMSGGVDSSVAAALLLRQGYEVTGMFTINYDDGGGECWRADYQDALRVAAKLGIKLLKLDFSTVYKKLVLSYMFKEYQAGRTPNPDVLCNRFIKFGVWLVKARRLGFAKLATGHYARLHRSASGNHVLWQAKDKNKDQTYFLNQLKQEQLSQVLFPLGDYTKNEVRKLARKFNLPTAGKKESVGICFVGQVPMKEFLQKRIKAKPGKIVMSDNRRVIGAHEGLSFYTIGQRHIGARGGGVEPLYVVDKNLKANQLLVGYSTDSKLVKREIKVKDVNWISGQKPIFPLKCKVRLRHQQPLQNCHLDLAGGYLLVRLAQAQRAVAPGQFAVFYLKNNCLGGGVIFHK